MPFSAWSQPVSGPPLSRFRVGGQDTGMPNAPLSPGDQFGATVGVERHGNAVVLRVAGELDLLTTPTLVEACTQELRKRPAVLVIDLTRVTFLASVGMSAIVAAHEEGGDHTKVRVVGGTRDTMRPIRVTGLDNLLSVYPELSAALEDA
jgi:anti-sigma B factor antagonist